MTVQRLFETIQPELLSAFSQIPDFGTIGLTIHLIEGEPVKIEWSGSTMKKLEPKAERGGIK
jgi:hypothetical protein